MASKNPRWVLFLPLFFALAVIFGMFIGRHLDTRATGGPTNSMFNSRKGDANKLNEVLQLIADEYVDTVNVNDLTEKTINAILEQLDPHSSYIPPVDLQAFNEELEGNFEGIGVEFNLVKDTIVVVSAIPGGPSESVGIHSGDRIITIDGEGVAGKKLKNEDVIKRLRGDKGTKVTVEVLRRGSAELLPFTIKRDKIPLYSMDAAYMVDREIGYIKINRFAETTYDEYKEAFDKLSQRGMKKLILDLRGNPGGYLNTATDLADEFLTNKKLIVYTQGKARKKRYYYATTSGDFESQPLVVLVDEGSASASEIVAGSVQDNDRGMIIGRRTFGKGLVQEQIEFKDGSAMRLTVARYYTASGRCIQRPYTDGVEKYYQDYYDSMDPSKLGLDSADTDTAHQFQTLAGRTVYGGGGITPDVVVPYDTAEYSVYLSRVVSKGITYDFCFDYADKHRKQLEGTYKNYLAFAQDRAIGQSLLAEFTTYAAGKGVPRDEAAIQRCARYLVSRLKALIARNIWNNEAFYYILNTEDNTFSRAVDMLRKQ